MIRFSKYIWLYFLISAAVIIPGVYSLLRFGLRPSIDFTGGTLLELKFPQAISQSFLENSAQKINMEVASVQRSGETTYLIRMKPQTDEQLEAFRVAVASQSASLPLVVRNESVGPILGKELLTKAMVAAVLAMIAILSYVAWAFKNIKFGVCAVLALIHDLLVVLGSFSLFGHFWGIEVDTLFVTAFLTTMSFSVHDTIVVFDRIREFLRKGARGDFAHITNQALMETMNRSLTNSLTIIFMLLALILMGGATTRWFVTALLIGTVSGTYSSPFVATPLLILWDHWENRGKKFK